MNEHDSSDPKYRPGDIVNGHVLGADGTQWLPLAPGSPRGQSDDYAGDGLSGGSLITTSEIIRSALVRSYVFLGVATIAGLIGAVTFARAAAQGGVVWTGGGLVAVGLLYLAFKSNLAAVRASKVLSEFSPLVPRRSLLPFVAASLGALLAIGAVAWAFWTESSSLAVGDCLTFDSRITDCSSGGAAWRVSQQVADPKDCSVDAAGDSNYVESDGRYFCLRLLAGS